MALAGVFAFSDVRSGALLEKSPLDERIRIAAYSSERIYPLYGYVGYQIDLQFEPGESFVGLAAGDIEGLSFVAQDNHLFLKPKAAKVGTNLTVLTSKRQYQFDYAAIARRPDRDLDEVIYAVRFTYPPPPQVAKPPDREALTETALAHGAATRARNIDYWFCGRAEVRPTAAWDDGVHTWLTFAPKSELPAIFVRNEDGTESLLNFSIEAGDVVIQRVAHRFIVRRGALTGCIVNQGFSGSGDPLSSHTVSPSVERETRSLRPGAAPDPSGGAP
jgi:type IV secretion system protein VirB9